MVGVKLTNDIIIICSLGFSTSLNNVLFSDQAQDPGMGTCTYVVLGVCCQELESLVTIFRTKFFVTLFFFDE